MQWCIHKDLLVVLGLFLLQPVVAHADDDDWKEDKYWEHEHEARKKALERDYEARKKDLGAGTRVLEEGGRVRPRSPQESGRV